MIKKEIVVKNEEGLHARPSGILANAAMKFESEIKIIKDGYEVNAKSIMGLLSLAAGKGTRLIVVIDGRDENEAIGEIERLFESKFDEE